MPALVYRTVRNDGVSDANSYFGSTTCREGLLRGIEGFLNKRKLQHKQTLQCGIVFSGPVIEEKDLANAATIINRVYKTDIRLYNSLDDISTTQTSGGERGLFFTYCAKTPDDFITFAHVSSILMLLRTTGTANFLLHEAALDIPVDDLCRAILNNIAYQDSQWISTVLFIKFFINDLDNVHMVGNYTGCHSYIAYMLYKYTSVDLRTEYYKYMLSLVEGNELLTRFVKSYFSQYQLSTL